MNAITLRNIPPEVSRAIRKKAEAEGTSLNQTVISLLEEVIVGKKKSRTLHHDLDHFAGSWTEDEADAFDAALGSQRTIDPDLWK